MKRRTRGVTLRTRIRTGQVEMDRSKGENSVMSQQTTDSLTCKVRWLVLEEDPVTPTWTCRVVKVESTEDGR